MNFDSLTAVSPIDGRYANKCGEFQEIFSEYGLIKRRVLVECTWLKALAAEPKIRECRLTAKQAKAVDKVAADFSVADARRVKAHGSAVRRFSMRCWRRTGRRANSTAAVRN